MTIGKKMGLGFGVLLALVATLAFVVLINLADTHRQFSFVIEHEAPVIANARHLLTLVVDMETGQRGFVITGKDEFLEPYEKAVDSFADLLEEEKVLVSDNPAQVRLLEKIEDSVQEWQQKAAAPEIAMRRKVGEATVDAYQLQEILAQGKGKRIMDSFMALGHEVEVFFSEQGDWEGAFVAEVVEKCMTDRESGQRGFLITGREEFLEKYAAGEQTKLPVFFARLRAIIADRGVESELSGKIDQLERLAVQWSRTAAEPELSARRLMNKHPESLKDVADLLEVGTGKKILDRIRGHFTTFIEIEEKQTASSFAKASQASRNATSITVILTLAFLIFGGIMATAITQGITKPVRDLAGAIEMVATGDLGQEIKISSRDEIGNLSKSFNQMVNDLRQLEEHREQISERLWQATIAADSANQAKSEFLANMSHEIRTPMTAILSYADLLSDEKDVPQHAREAIDIIQRNGKHLLAIINDILDMSKIEAGKMTVENVEISPKQIVTEVVSLLKPRVEGKGIRIAVEYDGLIPERIESDPTRLRQILLNLLGNAVKFTEVGAVTIRVAAEAERQVLRICVADTGIGMDTKQCEAIARFDAFNQADGSTTREFGGTGLGLRISHSLAQLLGGEIEIASELGVGSSFTLTVQTGDLTGVPMLSPKEISACAHHVAGARSDAADEFDNKPIAGLQILLAEDGPDNQRLISHILKKAGAEVTIAENGQVALELALAARDAAAPFDVVLMDIQMPVLDGCGATAQLREHNYQEPIIALTAHAMAQNRQQCLDAGCDDYATKPIDRVKLIAMLESHVSKRVAARRTQEDALEPLVSELDDDDLREIVEEFVGRLPDILSAIEQAFHEQDLNSLKTLVHRLKGAGGAYGFPTITDAAKQIETSAKAGDEPETIAKQIRELGELCSRARATAPMA